MRRNGDKSASYLMIRHSSGLEQEAHEITTAPHGHCNRKRPSRPTSWKEQHQGTSYEYFSKQKAQNQSSAQKVNNSLGGKKVEGLFHTPNKFCLEQRHVKTKHERTRNNGLAFYCFFVLVFAFNIGVRSVSLSKPQQP